MVCRRRVISVCVKIYTTAPLPGVKLLRLSLRRKKEDIPPDSLEIGWRTLAISLTVLYHEDLKLVDLSLGFQLWSEHLMYLFSIWGGKKTTLCPAYIVRFMRLQLTCMLEGESTLLCLVFFF